MWPFNKKHPVINFECDSWAVRKYAAVRPAREFVPEKFQNLPPFVDKKEHLLDSIKTVRACPGISEYMGLGYVIPAWCDIELFPENNGQSVRARYSDPKYNHAIHYPEQLGNFLEKTFSVRSPVKLDNPWRVYSQKNWSILYLPMYYWEGRNWEAVPGIIDHDIGALVSPINIMLKEPKYTIIKQGEPLVQLVPIYREEVLAKSSDVTETAMKRNRSILGLHSMTFKGWTKFMRERKQYKLDAQDTDLPGDQL
jgi:hypothetical protein